MFNVIVVDDGSADKTFETARKAGAIALRHPVNRGVGAATITGIEKAKSLGSGVFVTLDADEQHFPEEIMKLESKEKDLVYENTGTGTRIYRIKRQR